MSLAGLDAPTVVEAYQAAQSEATGWFLVKYISRDTVDVLKRGTGGVSDVRGAVEQYEEKSPLFGMLQYRRKRVVLKYVPEGTSRLLQVRLSVQFQSVLDAFTPHDTVFSFTAASELTESALALCTMLLPASNSSTTSNSSLRRRRLNEISEDGEEAGAAPPRGSAQPDIVEDVASTDYARRDLNDLPASALLAKTLLAKRKEADAAGPVPAPTTTSTSTSTPAVTVASVLPPAPAPSPSQPTILQIPDAARPPRHESLTPQPSVAVRLTPSPQSDIDKALPSVPNSTPSIAGLGLADSVLDAKPAAAAAAAAAQPQRAADAKPTDVYTSAAEHAKHLSTAESDSISQWSSQVASYAPAKPKKKKLGPRPHIEPPTRPRTSGASGASEVTIKLRPVANLPTSIRVSNRTSNNLPLRPGSQQSSKSVPGRFASFTQSSVLPPLPSPSHVASFYRPESRPAASIAGSVITEASTASPEKLRLMKALQLRKRNMLLAQRTSASTQATVSSHTHSGSVASTNTSREQSSSISTVKSEAQEPLANIDEKPAPQNVSTTASPSNNTHRSEDPSTEASSFTSREASSEQRHSLSSDTSSSITPKPAPETERAYKPPHPPAPVPKMASSPRPVELGNPVAQTSATEVKDDRGSENSGPSPPLPATSQLVMSPMAKAPETPALAEPIPRKDDDLKEQQTSSPLLSPNVAANKWKRRKPVPEALRVVSSTEVSEMSDDDSFLYELQNATVHEAKPMSVARTPVTPVVANVGPGHVRDLSRSVSTPMDSRAQNPPSPTGQFQYGKPRKSSTALPQWPPASGEALVPLTKKATLGHGISKRIKALEVLSTRESTSPPRQTVADIPAKSSAFTSFMKRSSTLLHQPGPNPSTTNPAPKKLPGSPIADEDETEEPLQPWLQRHGSTTQILPPSQKGETVSVTARIIRDHHDADPPSLGESFDMNLYRSPLTVEHERNDGSQFINTKELSLASMEASKSPKSEKGEKGRFSFSSHRSATQSKIPYSESTGKLSMTSNHRRGLPRSASDNSSFTDERSKGSRAARLMQRVTNLTSGNRRSAKNAITSSPRERGRDQQHPSMIAEGSEAGPRPSISESLLHVVDIGDVNVQFPETMLWKRRFMRIDDQGYLIFSPPANTGSFRGVSRKYHLADFRLPTLPDREREEMAWSIVMDLKDGTTIQCACESRHAQQQVLSMLIDAHSAYHQLYGQ